MRGRDDCGRHNLDPGLVRDADRASRAAEDPFWDRPSAREFRADAAALRFQARRASRQGARQQRVAHRRAAKLLGELGHDPDRVMTDTRPERAVGRGFGPASHRSSVRVSRGVQVAVDSTGRGQDLRCLVVASRADGQVRELPFRPDVEFDADPSLRGQRQQAQAIDTALK